MDKLYQGFIIGGSPSTGSSLLRQILNRHSKIVCAPETHIWCKEKIFQDWNRYKQKLIKKSIFGLVSEGLFHFVGIDKSQIPNYNNSVPKNLLADSPDIYTFFSLFMKEYYDLQEGQIYGEKTPANSINFKNILQSSSDILCIHTVRNPYDAIASLVARGKTPFEATAIYLYNSAHGMSCSNDERVIIMRYENLVENPKAEISNLLSSLSLDFEANVLESGNKRKHEVTKLESWNYDETDKVQKGSVGRFQTLSNELQSEIILYVWHLCLTNVLDLTVHKISEINELLGYETIRPRTPLSPKQRNALVDHEKLITSKRNNFNSENYPLCFNE